MLLNFGMGQRWHSKTWHSLVLLNSWNISTKRTPAILLLWLRHLATQAVLPSNVYES